MMPVAEKGEGTQGDDAVRKPVEPLYRGLQPRWCGLDEAGVGENQRQRLFGAMLAACASKGYTNTSVSELTRMAGVSKRTVYDRFEDKEDYFLATYDFVVERATARISSAYRSEPDPARGLCRAFEAFIDETVEEPGVAKLALIETLGAGPAALGRMERGQQLFERMIAASIPGEEPLPPLIVKGIVGGVERVTRQYLLAGKQAELLGCAVELSNWVACYEPCAANAVASAPVRSPAPSKHHWNAWLRNGDEQTRILRATAVVAAREGYANLTTDAITKLAMVPPDALSERYESVEACFLASLELLLGVEALACATRASLEGPDWRLRVHKGIIALMHYLADHPVLAQAVFVEALSVGPSGMDCLGRLSGKFTDLLVSLIPENECPPELVSDLIVGSIWAVSRHVVLRNVKHLLPGLSGQMAFLALAPVAGAQQAARTILAAS